MKNQRKVTRFCLITANKPGSSNYEAKRMYPPSVNIPIIDVIYDSESKTQRTIRYIPGEKSIYSDEQSVKDLPKKRSEIIFYDGWKVVDETEILLLQYLRACNFNSANKNRLPGTTVIFKEFLPHVDKQVIIDKEEVEIKARASVINMPFEDMKQLAKAMGLSTDREVAEIKHDLLVRAKHNPEKFLRDMNSKNMKRRWGIIEAIDTNIISLNKQNATISWVGGGVIFQGAVGTDIIEDFAEYTQNTEDGKNIFERIQRLYEKLDEKDYGSLTADEIIEKCIQSSIFTKKGQFTYYNNEKLAAGINTIRAKIDDDINFRKELLEKISIFEQEKV
jgi:hypothetical protein